jgi:hypothetical protein
MNPIDLAKSFIRLSNYRVGVREATCLFLSLGGTTIERIAKASQENPRVTRCRINSLRAKRLIEKIESSANGNIYKPSRQGLDVINHVLGKVLS